MAILAFQKPDKVVMIHSDNFFGKFEFRPLEPGYGVTIGNALRRILLSSLEGYAITSVKIDKADHEFTSIKGVVEDVTEIILNLKKVRLIRTLEDNDSEKVTVNISNKTTFTGQDISNALMGFKVINSDLVICNMDPSASFSIELQINKGRGYVPAEENKVTGSLIGTIAIDSIFTPIKNVKYFVENYRVEQKTDYEKLIMEVTTDGSIMPKDALQEAAKILITHFMLFSDERITIDIQEKSSSEEFDEGYLHMRQLLQTKLVDLDLSVRALNCLKAAEVETLGELVQYNRNDLLKFRNFGKKSLDELDKLVKNKNLTFGMNIIKYKLD
ncbi:MAG: DNA-directed RNA polymerase subunit alpha [Bacteroidales bacterium]|nr:DNA-directed RNA polymerase subunit alpha [Bacteroidales bacterium]